MKRKIAILLAAVMTTAMLPMNVMADSANSVNKVIDIADGDLTDGVYLKIVPKDEVKSGDSIIITINNATFDKADVLKAAIKNGLTVNGAAPTGAYKSPTKSTADSPVTYDDIFAKYAGDDSLENIFQTHLGQKYSELPYKISYNGKKEMQVTLFPITASYTDTTTAGVTGPAKPYYNIPIIAAANGTGNITVSINSNGTTVTGGGEYKVAVSSNKSGSTTTTVDEVTTFTDVLEVEDITIKENVKGTFKKDQTVKVRLSGGFEIVSPDKITIAPGSNATFTSFKPASGDIKDNEFSFKMPIGETKIASSIKITGLEVQAEDETKNWGDVSVTVSGADITKETIKVGTRTDYGFKMTVLDEATTILSGRTHVANSDLDEDDFKTATVKFEETSKNSWITARALEFSVPEGVKIIDAEIDEEENVNLNGADIKITNDGQTVKFAKGLEVDDTDCSSFEMNLYVSIDADFTGEIPVSVAGGGLPADALEDVVVANAIAPIAIDSKSTKVNMGYQAMATADITITEAQEGVLLDGKQVEVAIDSLYGTGELGFADDNIDYTIDGELQIKNFKVKSGNITFTVDKTSYNEPSSITIKNVKVGTTRSVPYGSYDFTVGGDAVVNNYDEKFADDAKYPADLDLVKEEIAYFDTNDKYSFADYLVVAAGNDTLNSVVEVTIGEKTILMDGEAVDMDVAAYIQASSNSTLVPLRFVALALGVDSANANNADNSGNVMFDANTKTATILYTVGTGQKIIQFQAGSSVMTVDGTKITMENGVKAEITDSRMFVPFRALGQALGVSVSWDADTRTAIYNAK